ncbi:hypothetical protein PPO43_12175 [Saprospira sp. CCB-QB6]|uniref:hypothetical protein n=1 Tax=Saprospira sp. CCB-QB6 TaxID=3023936 RepID=UPI00234B5731|nr:hypothetical protein [Saprospira sp. CCB-QB6]WCL80726.1 hypothetical protein PPO43_12175 [Saprospira sp. CCB-QB6]
MRYPREWIHLDNFIDNWTENSLKRMYLLSTDHIHKLAAKAPNDPVIQEILDFVEPAYRNFIQQYRVKTLQRNLYRQKTAEFHDLLRLLSAKKIRSWDVQIQIVYDAKSATYMALLPEGRNPFQKGAYEMRIEAVNTLGEALSSDAQLGALATEVLAFGQQMQATRQEQQGNEGTKDNHADTLEALRQELAIVLFWGFSRLKTHYYRELYLVKNFYELQYFRKRKKRGRKASAKEEEFGLFELELAPESRLVQLEGLLRGGESVRITHLEGAAVKYYSAANAADTPTEVYDLHPNQTVHLQLPSGHRLLLLDNPAANMAKVQLELI